MPDMLSRRGSRSLSVFALVAIGLILLWRMHLLKDARPTAHSGSARATAEAGRTPGRDLSWDEREGGHTLARHVGKSDADLARRLERESGVAAASTFVDRATAEAVVGITVQREAGRIDRWLRQQSENLALDYFGERSQVIGFVLLRGESHPVATHRARIVLRRRGDGYFILTAYPVES